jgi:hypothetical protein
MRLLDRIARSHLSTIDQLFPVRSRIMNFLTGNSLRPTELQLCLDGIQCDNTNRRWGRGYMPDNEKELWVDLYRMAMMELANAKIAGRIGDARIEIAARLEKLRDMPDLHTDERQAIDEALTSLHSLERDEERAADAERLIAERAWQSLRVIAPRFETLDKALR